MIVDQSSVMEYWCPMARVSDETLTSVNRYYHGIDSAGSVAPGGCYCLGNKCMAWQWKDQEAGLGYCGLAGQV